jgi:uncharacterized protein (UPF0210 family)
MTTYSRRDIVALMAGAVALPFPVPRGGFQDTGAPRDFRIRTITAGVPLADPANLAPVTAALAALRRAKAAFVDEGFEVQTVRVATTPLVAGVTARDRERLLPALRAFDAALASADAVGSIGPVLQIDSDDPELPPWIAELFRTTTRLSASIVVASPTRGVHAKAAAVAARTMNVLASTTPEGIGNFRFAAAACIPAGTPFFPVGYHGGPASMALGLETAGVVERALTGGGTAEEAGRRLQAAMNAALTPVEAIGRAVAGAEKLQYLGLDPSPAPGLDRSIGAALEALIGGPFGSASTLHACSIVTAVLKDLKVRTCGYAGLMLPVLEDPRLAQRAAEGRYGLRDLLLYSSVCGTGLDVVPIPGETSVDLLSRLILDVAALSAKWQKPLSARLFPVPGKVAGETTAFRDPLMTNCPIFPVA